MKFNTPPKHRGLQIVLLIKIVITLFVWALPLLTPDPILNFLTAHLLGIPNLQPKVFIHLLGATFLSLVIGYIAALIRIKQDKDVKHIILVGVVSNGLASIILFIYGLQGSYQDLLLIGQIILWGSAVATGLITLGLVSTNN